MSRASRRGSRCGHRDLPAFRCSPEHRETDIALSRCRYSGRWLGRVPEQCSHPEEVVEHDVGGVSPRQHPQAGAFHVADELRKRRRDVGRQPPHRQHRFRERSRLLVHHQQSARFQDARSLRRVTACRGCACSRRASKPARTTRPRARGSSRRRHGTKSARPCRSGQSVLVQSRCEGEVRRRPPPNSRTGRPGIVPGLRARNQDRGACRRELVPRTRPRHL